MISNSYDGMPPNFVSVVSNSGVQANVDAVATLPAVVGKLCYMERILIAGVGATAGSVVVLTITGLKGGTISIPIAVPANPLQQVGPIYIPVFRQLPAAALNTAIVATLPALGVGSTHAIVTLIGRVG